MPCELCFHPLQVRLQIVRACLVDASAEEGLRQAQGLQSGDRFAEINQSAGAVARQTRQIAEHLLPPVLGEQGPHDRDRPIIAQDRGPEVIQRVERVGMDQVSVSEGVSQLVAALAHDQPPPD